MPFRRRFSCRAVLIASVLSLVPAVLWAGKPAPPPPPPAQDLTNFEWRPELGGWLDKTTNVIWGYSCMQMVNAAPTNYGATLFAEDYPALMQDSENYFLDAAADADAGGDTAARDRYLYLADVCNDAAAYEDWRLPTLDEAKNAYYKGLFTYGPNGLNGYESAPGNLGLAYDGVSTWTSTLSSNKKYGFTRYWIYNPASGVFGEYTETSHVDVIVVRTHTP